jgi:outer membrane protein assembly complex protein YaeT
LALWGSPARADEPSRPPEPAPYPTADEVLASVTDFGGFGVRKIRFPGAAELEDDDLEKAIYHRRPGRWPWSRKMPFLPREFVRDIRRLEILYARRGFPAARVRGQVRPRADDEQVELEFAIVEGPPLMVKSVDLEGWPKDAGWKHSDDREPAKVLAALPLKRAERLDRTEVEKSLKQLTQRLTQQGFWQAAARDSVRPAADGAYVTFQVTPGERFRVRQVALTPNAEQAIGDLPPRLVLDEIEFDRGEFYDPKRIADGREDLIALDVFRRVAIEPTPVAPDSLDLLIDVARARGRAMAFGGGYGSEDKLRVKARWLERDFFGGGRRLEVQGQASWIERELNASVTQPRIFGTRSDFSVRGFLADETEDNYDLTRFGGGLGIQRPLTRDLTLRVTADHEQNELTVKVPDESLPEEGPSELTDLKVFFTFDSSDDRFAPTHGTRMVLALDGALDQVWSDYTYGAAWLAATHYYQLGRGRIVAVQGRTGVALPGGRTSEMPVWRRIYGGGSTDMRSYARRTLGPLDSEGNGLGGEAGLEVSAELRQAIAGPLGIALFAEAGQVWLKVGDAGLGELDYGAGAGLRLATPVGPLRVDVGVKLTNYDPQLQPVVGHFSIGEAF